MNYHTKESAEMYNEFLQMKKDEDANNPTIDDHTVCAL